MTFEISDTLVLERALVISAIIVLFGFISIGGLWLLRKFVSAPSPTLVADRLGAGGSSEFDDRTLQAISSLMADLRRDIESAERRLLHDRVAQQGGR